MERGPDPDAPEPSILDLRLFGGFSLNSDGEAITTVDAPRLQSLLAHLVLHRDVGQPRERLAFLFWPDSEEPQARTNLRQALHHLRRALPEPERFIESEARTVRWRPDAPMRLDVEDFEQLVGRASDARERGESEDERGSLEAALGLYSGDLMPSIYDDWLVPERERLRDAFLGAAERLAELLELDRDYRGAIGWARRLWDEDSLNEGSCRRLMRLYALSGDRAAALRTYHGYATALAREAGVEPGAEAREAYERLLEGGAAVPSKRRWEARAVPRPSSVARPNGRRCERHGSGRRTGKRSWWGSRERRESGSRDSVRNCATGSEGRATPRLPAAAIRPLAPRRTHRSSSSCDLTRLVAGSGNSATPG